MTPNQETLQTYVALLLSNCDCLGPSSYGVIIVSKGLVVAPMAMIAKTKKRIITFTASERSRGCTVKRWHEIGKILATLYKEKAFEMPETW